MRQYLHETDLDKIAIAISETIVIRSYEDGNSCDVRRKARIRERDIIRGVARGALYTLNYGEDNRNNRGKREDAILDMAEFTLLSLKRGVNAYDTIYNPLKAIVEVWRMASEGTETHLTPWAVSYVERLYPDCMNLFKKESD